MQRIEILSKVEEDINYVPTLEEYKLIADMNFSIGVAPIFSINLLNGKDKDLIGDIEAETKDSRPNGLYELYCSLQSNGCCESYDEHRIYYVAYTLACKYIDFIVDGSEYKLKLNKKREAIIELQRQLEENS